MKNWFAVLTKPQAEGEVAMRLNEQGFETLLPCSLVKRRIGTRYVAVMRATFPRYLFAATEPGQSLRPINTTAGVSTVLFGPNGPLNIPARVVDLLRERGSVHGAGNETKAWPQVGDRVRVLAGPFENFMAEVAALDGDKEIAIFLNVFGRAVTSHLSLDQVGAAA